MTAFSLTKLPGVILFLCQLCNSNLILPILIILGNHLHTIEFLKGGFTLIFLHNKICEKNALPFYLLLLDCLISSFFKECFCGNGCMRCYLLHPKRPFQFVANCRGNALPLIVLMNIQSIQISVSPDITKPYNHPINFRNNSFVFAK